MKGTVIILRRTRPELPRPFAIPESDRGIPVLAVFGLGSVVPMMTQREGDVGLADAQSLGRPSTRSPMMFRWISLVPPAMVYWRELTTLLYQRGASGTSAVG